MNEVRHKMFYRARKLLLEPVLPHVPTDTTKLSPVEKQYAVDRENCVRRIRAAFNLEGRQYRSHALRKALYIYDLIDAETAGSACSYSSDYSGTDDSSNSTDTNSTSDTELSNGDEENEEIALGEEVTPASEHGSPRIGRWTA